MLRSILCRFAVEKGYFTEPPRFPSLPKVGEKVAAGQKLLVTEAMKLETVVKAPISGLVREIVAGAGESVEGGDLLVVIEETGASAGSPTPPAPAR